MAVRDLRQLQAAGILCIGIGQLDFRCTILGYRHRLVSGYFKRITCNISLVFCHGIGSYRQITNRDASVLQLTVLHRLTVIIRAGDCELCIRRGIMAVRGLRQLQTAGFLGICDSKSLFYCFIISRRNSLRIIRSIITIRYNFDRTVRYRYIFSIHCSRSRKAVESAFPVIVSTQHDSTVFSDNIRPCHALIPGTL